MKEGGGSGGGGWSPGGMTGGLPKVGMVVKYLLIMNIVVFVVQMFLDKPSDKWRYGFLSSNLGVTVGAFWQVWRYITFQFLHGGPWHIIMNMLGLYILGSPLEKHFGSKQFLRFYLICGFIAGVVYVIIGAIYPQFMRDLPIIGASGGVYGLILACAILMPHIKLIFLFFPVPIRLAALILCGVMILTVGQALAAGNPDEAMSDVAHLGGAATAAFWIWVLPRVRESLSLKQVQLGKGAWERKLKHRATEEAEVNRILDKIKNQGLTSLSSKEKKILQQATKRQKQDEP